MDDVSDAVEPPALRNAPMPTKSAMARGVIGFLVVLGSVAALTGLFAGRFYWLFDLLNHFWFHYFLYFTLSTFCLVLLRGRKLLLLSAVMLALCVWQVLPLFSDLGRTTGTGPELTLLHLNVNTHSGDKLAVANYLREQDADLVFLQEVNQAWLDALDGQIGSYALVLAQPQEDNFGIACYVRTDPHRVTIESSTFVDLTDGQVGVPAIELVARVADGSGEMLVSILSVHTLPPVSSQYSALRDRQLASAEDWAVEVGANAVIIGDLNATPWSAPLRKLITEAALGDSLAGRGQQASWPARLPGWLGIPIDHCLHGEGLTSTSRELGPACGSDHRALIVALRGVKP